MNKFRELCFSKKKGFAEYFALLLYITGLAVIGYFHEHWFDEAQAWQIARSASVREILTVVPHYEGHPPLWHLVLVPFAKLGAPYHFSLCFVNILFCSAAAALLLFRSPFPKAVRCTLPFTYFFFYQYGVICRPYSMMTLAFMLIAMTYSSRDRKPWRYVLSLCFLCMTTTICIIIAGGLCIVWTGEILAELKNSRRLNSFWKDKRFLPLLTILILAIAILLITRTADDCYYAGIEYRSDIKAILSNWSNHLTMLYMPAESWIGTLTNYSRNSGDDIIGIILSSVCGAAIWAFLIAVTRKNKKLLTFLVPYLMYAIFLSYFYLSVHHFGIGTMFHVFILWIMAEQPGGIILPQTVINAAGKINSHFVKRTGIAGGIALYMLNVLFSAVSSFNDIRYQYFPIAAVDYIKEHHLEDKKIMISWDYEYGEINDSVNHDSANENSGWFIHLAIPSNHPPVSKNRTLLSGLASTYLPYFDSNIFMNFNVRFPDDLYMHYAYKEDVQKEFSLWREQGLPEFIIDYCPIDEVYDEKTLNGVRYAVIAEFPYHMNFKLNTTDQMVYMYIREDIVDDYPDIDILYDPRIAGEYVPPSKRTPSAR